MRLGCTKEVPIRSWRERHHRRNAEILFAITTDDEFHCRACEQQAGAAIAC